MMGRVAGAVTACQQQLKSVQNAGNDRKHPKPPRLLIHGLDNILSLPGALSETRKLVREAFSCEPKINSQQSTKQTPGRVTGRSTAPSKPLEP